MCLLMQTCKCLSNMNYIQTHPRGLHYWRRLYLKWVSEWVSEKGSEWVYEAVTQSSMRGICVKARPSLWKPALNAFCWTKRANEEFQRPTLHSQVLLDDPSYAMTLTDVDQKPPIFSPNHQCLATAAWLNEAKQVDIDKIAHFLLYWCQIFLLGKKKIQIMTHMVAIFKIVHGYNTRYRKTNANAS